MNQTNEKVEGISPQKYCNILSKESMLQDAKHHCFNISKCLIIMRECNKKQDEVQTNKNKKRLQSSRNALKNLLKRDINLESKLNEYWVDFKKNSLFSIINKRAVGHYSLDDILNDDFIP
jgi:hypothetical protein